MSHPTAYSRSDLERSRSHGPEEHDASGQTEEESPKRDLGVQKHLLRVQVCLLAKINTPGEFKGLRPITILQVSERIQSKTVLQLAEAHDAGNNPEGTADPGMLGFRNCCQRSE